MKLIKIGIAPQYQIRKRLLAIAKGDLKPKPSDPKIWFTSSQSLTQALRDPNHPLFDEFHRSSVKQN